MPVTRVLIVEDELITAEDLRFRIDSLGYVCSGVVSSGEQAIEVAEREHPDVILMDIMLRGKMDGIQAAEIIYEKMDIPVIFLSAHSDQETLKRVSAANASAYLLKPFRDQEFQLAVEITCYKHQTERRIRASEENYRLLIEGTEQPILKINSDMEVVFLNHTAAAINGASAEELQGKTVRQLFSPGNAERVESLIRQVFESQRSMTDQQLWTFKGREYYFDSAFYPIVEGNGSAKSIMIIARDETEKRNVRRVLEETEGRFQRLFHNMPAGFYMTSPDGKILDVNMHLVEMLGYGNPDEVKRKISNEAYAYEADRKRFWEMMNRDGAVTGFEVQWRCKDGSILWVHESARAIKDKNGQIQHYEGIVEDITERKQAEAEIQYRLDMEKMISGFAHRLIKSDELKPAIQKSLAELRMTFQADRASVIFLDSNSERIADVLEDNKRGVSRTKKKWTGIDLRQFPWWIEQIVHQSVIRFSGVSELPETAEKEKKLYQELGISSQLAVPVFEGNELVGFLCLDNLNDSLESRTIDVSLIRVFANILGNALMRQHSHEQLRHEQDLLHAIMDHMPDTIYFKDRKSKFTRINQAQARLLQIKTPDEAIGKTDAHFFEPEFAAETFADEQKLMRKKEPLITKLELLKTNSGKRMWSTATKVPICDSRGEVMGLVGITRNITELKLAEERLAQTAKALEKSNENLQNFAYVASHDLQEPLRMVSSYLQLLQKRYGNHLDESADEYIHYAVDGATRMKQLILDLLEFSRVDTYGTPFEITDLNEILQIVQMHLKVAVEESHAKIRIDHLPRIVADSGQMIQLFQNLIQNALKFRSEKKPNIHIRFTEKADDVQIHVKDNGVGIDPAYRDKIFQIFKRLHGHDKYSGTGIGLSICKKIVERHDGRISVESEPGKGSTFLVSFPKSALVV